MVLILRYCVSCRTLRLRYFPNIVKLLEKIHSDIIWLGLFPFIFPMQYDKSVLRVCWKGGTNCSNVAELSKIITKNTTLSRKVCYDTQEKIQFRDIKRASLLNYMH